jgi:hypothetical protein
VGVAPPTHRSMAAEVGLDAALSLVEQRGMLAVTAAANGSSWLPGLIRGLNYSLSMIRNASATSTMVMPAWLPNGSRCLRSPETIRLAFAATAAAMT